MNGKKFIYQCTRCGCTHKNYQTPLQDDIYAEMHCNKCKEYTPHLECGQDILSYYELYDPTLDERYYTYVTKQND